LNYLKKKKCYMRLVLRNIPVYPKIVGCFSRQF